MRIKIILLTLLIILFGCTHISTLSDLRAKYGPPAKIEETQNTTTYFYFYKVRFRTTWEVSEFVATKDGKIIEKRQYYRQPETPPK
jgi:hypothetical protein